MKYAYPILSVAARLLMAMGLVCILLGAYLLWQNLSFAKDAVRATGTVVGYHELRVKDTLRWRPRIRYQTQAGDIITFEGQLSASTQRFAVGAQVPLVYKPTDPMRARVDLFTDNWLGITVAGVLGVVAFIAGVLIRRGSRQVAAGQ